MNVWLHCRSWRSERVLGFSLFPNMAFLQKIKSIDASMRLLVPKKVSEDDMLVDYGAKLVDRSLAILENLHGKEMKDTVSFFLHCCRCQK